MNIEKWRRDGERADIYFWRSIKVGSGRGGEKKVIVCSGIPDRKKISQIVDERKRKGE